MIDTPVTLRLQGADLNPDQLRAGELAVVITSLEAAIAALIQDSAPDIKPDQIRLSLTSVATGSTTLAFAPNLQTLALPAAERLIHAVNHNNFIGFPPVAIASLRKIIALVRKHHGVATIQVAHNATTLQATITEQLNLAPAHITGHTTLYGSVVRVGGIDPRVEFKPILKGKTLFCPAERSIVLQLRDYLYQTVAVHGLAVWDATTLDVIHFTIQSWLPYDPTPPVQAFAEIREKFGPYFDAIPDVDAWVAALRRGEE